MPPALADVCHACSRVSPSRQCPPPQDASVRDAVHQSLCGGKGHQGVGTCIRHRGVPVALSEYGDKELNLCQTRGVLYLPSQSLLASPLSLLSIAQLPDITPWI
jgi:hypothetical protein